MVKDELRQTVLGRGLYFQHGPGMAAGSMISGSAQTLSDHDRLILDLEGNSPTLEGRRRLCRQIGVDPERYPLVLDGLADTDAAYAYAPDLVRSIRAARSERFRFYRRNGRWRTWQTSRNRSVPE